jgi:riboflavin-specific deaminase-like protein
VLLEWDPQRRWVSRLASDDPDGALVDLYLPICSATSSNPITVGHLGQSLDGFIATHSGDSQFVTGADNLVHMHRLRALCSAVVVGAGTVASDDPQLTTRHVEGPNPLRVVFDPTRRLDSAYRVFADTEAPTLYVCAQSKIAAGESYVGRADVVGFDDRSEEPPVTQLIRLLRARGHGRIFVEGGGVTVSAFLDANLLDRLHIAIAPVLIGDGRPAVRIAPHSHLRDCRRPPYRVFRMGGDVLFDCALTGGSDAPPPGASTLTRVI